MIRFELRRCTVLFVLLIAVSAGALAQAPAACTPAAAASVTQLSIERVQTLSNVLGTAPSVPASVLASIQGGALEIRERLTYNPQNLTLSSTIFTVASGSPDPTPLLTFLSGSPLGSVILAIDCIYCICQFFRLEDP